MTRRSAGTTLLAFFITAVASFAADPRPNVLLILADDMGYGDVQAFNESSRIPTPNLNRLASEGMMFTDAHTPSAVCTPTRYGLLTGRYCWRSPLKRGVLFPPKDPPLIEDDRTTIASHLKSAGYRTHMVGKWHLGIAWARNAGGEVDFDLPFTNGPIEKGFDSFFGIAASLDMVPYVFLRDHQAVEPLVERQPLLGFPRYTREGPRGAGFNPGDALDALGGEVRRLIHEEARSRRANENAPPWFIYMPLTAPHKPVWPHERFVGSTDLGPYGDWVHQVDWTVGLVLDALEGSGQTEDTLVIFTSDNGSFMFRRGPGEGHHLADPSNQGYRPEDHTANYIWRGTKADIWEGGHRVPFIVRWPRQASSGRKVDTTICLTDILATLADVIDRPLPTGAGEDSFSFLPDLLGKPRPEPRPPVVHHSVNGSFAIRKGPWKLVLTNGSGGREKPTGKPFTKPYTLFNLAVDPSETTDVYSAHADIAQRLEAALEEIIGDTEVR